MRSIARSTRSRALAGPARSPRTRPVFAAKRREGARESGLAAAQFTVLSGSGAGHHLVAARVPARDLAGLQRTAAASAGVGVMQNIHAAFACPNTAILENPPLAGPLHTELYADGYRFQDGYILPPEGPGLGIDFDEDLARAHPFTGTGLHLQMQEAPCDYRHGNRFEGGAPSSTD